MTFPNLCKHDNPPRDCKTCGPLLSRIRNGDWLDAQTFPPLRWYVPGIIAQGYGLVTGPPKLGKSWFVLGVCLAVAEGGIALGCIGVEPVPVLYLALEDGDRRLQHRSRHLLGSATPIPARFEYVTAANPLEVSDFIDAWLTEHHSGLVCLDTLGRVIPPKLAGENEYQRDYRIGVALKDLADRHEAAVVAVHHVNKRDGGGDWMDSTSGTNGLNGAADWTLNLKRDRNATDAFIRVTGRDVIEAEYAATMSDGAWMLDGTTLDESASNATKRATTEGLGNQSAEIVRFVSKAGRSVTPKDIAERFDLSNDDAGKMLRRLAEAGRITKQSRGNYVRNVRMSESDSNDTPMFRTSDTSDTDLYGEDS
jgi:hypothetical protein